MTTRRHARPGDTIVLTGPREGFSLDTSEGQRFRPLTVKALDEVNGWEGGVETDDDTPWLYHPSQYRVVEQREAEVGERVLRVHPDADPLSAYDDAEPGDTGTVVGHVYSMARIEWDNDTPGVALALPGRYVVLVDEPAPAPAPTYSDGREAREGDVFENPDGVYRRVEEIHDDGAVTISRLGRRPMRDRLRDKDRFISNPADDTAEVGDTVLIVEQSEARRGDGVEVGDVVKVGALGAISSSIRLDGRLYGSHRYIVLERRDEIIWPSLDNDGVADALYRFALHVADSPDAGTRTAQVAQQLASALRPDGKHSWDR